MFALPRIIIAGIPALILFAIALLQGGVPDALRAQFYVGIEAEEVDVGEVIVADIGISADRAINVLEAYIEYPSDMLSIESLDYSESIISLWVDEPVYDNTEGELLFSGGILDGGFEGDGSVLRATFRAKQSGRAEITVSDGMALAHDGAGTDILVAAPVTTLTVHDDTTPTPTQAPVAVTGGGASISTPAPERVRGDINGDGGVTVIDMGILLSFMGGENRAADLNGDGKVDIKDLAICISLLNDE